MEVPRLISNYLMIRQLILMKSISILKHVYIFVQVDKLGHILNWSRLELPSQGWAKKDVMSPVRVPLE